MRSKGREARKGEGGDGAKRERGKEGAKRVPAGQTLVRPADLKGGGYLLSRFRSTIGAAGFNFSVRDGKRWSPRAVPALVFYLSGTRPPGPPLAAPARSARGVVSPKEDFRKRNAIRDATTASLWQVPCPGLRTLYFLGPPPPPPLPRRRGDSPFRSLRAISTARLSVSPRLHLRPIDVVVCDGPWMRPYLGAGFVLRCLQHLSCPDAATRRCGWRHNRFTGGPSGTVLSYWCRFPSSLDAHNR